LKWVVGAGGEEREDLTMIMRQTPRELKSLEKGYRVWSWTIFPEAWLHYLTGLGGERRKEKILLYSPFVIISPHKSSSSFAFLSSPSRLAFFLRHLPFRELASLPSQKQKSLAVTSLL
jgi:hypothetical protein